MFFRPFVFVFGTKSKVFRAPKYIELTQNSTKEWIATFIISREANIVEILASAEHILASRRSIMSARSDYCARSISINVTRDYESHWCSMNDLMQGITSRSRAVSLRSGIQTCTRHLIWPPAWMCDRVAASLYINHRSNCTCYPL